jgi:hypothetical protein
VKIPVTIFTLALSGLLLHGQSNVTLSTQQAGTLQRAEKMTDQEKSSLQAARNKVAEAQAQLAQVEGIIASAHSMNAQSWMEYSTWYEFDGDFILYRYQNYEAVTFTNTNH